MYFFKFDLIIKLLIIIYNLLKDSQNYGQYTYRNNQLDSLRMKANEEERLEEINKQIYSLQNLKQVSIGEKQTN